MNNKSSNNAIIILLLLQLLIVVLFFLELFKIFHIPTKDETLTDGIHIFLITFFVLVSISIFGIIRKNQKTLKLINSEEISSEQQEIISKKQLEEEEKRLQIQKENYNTIYKSIITDLNEQTSAEKFSEKLLSNIAKVFEIVQGMVFIYNDSMLKFKVSATYAFYSDDDIYEFGIGEGITGQVAKNKELLYVTSIPENYITILSGLGNSAPANLLIFPLLHNDKTIGIVELATFKKIDTTSRQIFKDLMPILGNNLMNMINK